MAMRFFTNIVLVLLTIITKYRMQKLDMYNTTNMYLQEITDYPILFKVMGVENFKFHIPDECKERKICEQIPDYLQEYITEIITMLSTKNIILHGVEDVDTPKSNTKNTSNTTQHMDEDLCSTKEIFYIPKAAADINNTWHIILNDNQHPQYTFRVEICLMNNSSCSNAYFPQDYTSKCIQKFTLRSMMALNEENEVVERLFQVPSCCSCGVKHV